MIGSKLKELLVTRRLSTSELAKRVRVSDQTLYSIIRRDNMTIDLDLLLRICRELQVPLRYFSGEDEGAAPQPEEVNLLSSYRAMDAHGRTLVDLVAERELARVQAERAAQEAAPGRVIPLYYTPAAAGYASPALGEDYEDYTVAAAVRADFAVRIDGDSMEPWLRDGSIALVRRVPIENGDVGLFFVDGDMKCKQYCRDNYGNVYLLSLNRARADADVTLPASSGVTICCFGKVLLDRRPPLLR